MIIGLHGPARSGKDTVYETLSKLHSGKVVRRAFADPLKLSAYRVFNPNGTLEEALAWADKMKTQGFVSATTDIGEGHHIKGRNFLQNYGTEAHRHVFGNDFWVDASLPKWDGVGHTESMFGVDYSRDLVVFTDVRFINEAERIRQWGGKVYRIQRDAVEVGDGHASEQALPDQYIDAILYNNGSLDDLTQTVRRVVLEALGINRVGA